MTLLALQDNFEDIVEEANGAPSVHNIQPTRWACNAAERKIYLSLDSARSLPVGDPTGKDVLFSCGAAAEGTAIALSRYNLRVKDIDALPGRRFPLNIA